MRTGILHVTLAAVVLALYAPAAGVAFVKDDYSLGLITEGSELSFRKFAENFLWPSAWKSEQLYRPLPVLIAMGEYALFGPEPAAFHATNIALHMFGVWLLFALLRRLSPASPGPAFLGALLFAVHPIHPETILWVGQRMVLMGFVLSVAALLQKLRSIEGRRGAAALTQIAFVGALLSKETALTLPGVFFLADLLLRNPAAPFRDRFRTACLRAIPSAIIIAAYFALRSAIFGTLTGTYGGMTFAAYAAHNRTLERLPASLWYGLVAVNREEIPPPLSGMLAAALATLALALPGLRLFRRLREPGDRRPAILLGAFAALSFLPTLPIFFVLPGLTNGRFLYQPLAALIGLLVLTAAGGRRPSAGLVPVLALLIATASFTTALNLNAWAGADLQIRTVCDGLADISTRHPGRPLVVLDVPALHHGVPTLDRSLALALREPFRVPPVPVVPLVEADADSRRAWFAEFVSAGPRATEPLWIAVRTRHGLSPGPFGLRLRSAEAVLQPLFGADEPPLGAGAPVLLGPPPGAAVSNRGPEPEFRFMPVPDAAAYRLRLTAAGGVSHTFRMTPGSNLAIDAGSAAFRISAGAAPSGVPDVWTALSAPWPAATAGWPVPARWRVEALGADGSQLGVSGSRNLVIFNEGPLAP